jgi:uncharacterized damage-inducible protein DinB
MTSSSPITPEQARFLLGATLPALRKEHDITRRVIAAIPLDKGDYRPDAVSKTGLELAWHIVAAEKRFFTAVCTGAFDFTPINRPDSVRNSADIAAWFDQTFATSLENVQRLTGEQLIRIIDFRGLFQFPAVAFVQIGLNHTIHHRGQLSMYLRPMGAKVPAIYGESYDSAQARLAEEHKAS